MGGCQSVGFLDKVLEGVDPKDILIHVPAVKCYHKEVRRRGGTIVKSRVYYGLLITRNALWIRGRTQTAKHIDYKYLRSAKDWSTVECLTKDSPRVMADKAVQKTFRPGSVLLEWENSSSKELLLLYDLEDPERVTNLIRAKWKKEEDLLKKIMTNGGW